MHDIRRLGGIVRDGVGIRPRAGGQPTVDVAELARRDAAGVRLAGVEVRLGQGVRGGQGVGDDEVGADVVDGEGADDGGFAEVVPAGAHVERAAEGGRARQHPAPVAADAQGDEGLRVAGDVAVGGPAAATCGGGSGGGGGRRGGGGGGGEGGGGRSSRSGSGCRSRGSRGRCRRS